MGEWLTHLLTGKDNSTFDLGRVSWVISMLTIIGHSIWEMLQHQAIGLMDIANAISVIVVAHGAALWAKKDTEPH